jgi:hypothetical protein
MASLSLLNHFRGNEKIKFTNKGVRIITPTPIGKDPALHYALHSPVFELSVYEALLLKK